jgi:hypothetical protein
MTERQSPQEGAARAQALNEAAGLARRKARALRRELEADPEYDSRGDELTPDESRIATLFTIADEIEALAKAPPDETEADIGF